MLAKRRGFSLQGADPPVALGAALSLTTVAATTGVLFALRQEAPAVSLGVVYLLAVLLVTTLCGLRFGLTTTLASAAAFNWFHLPPTGRFAIERTENWVALIVFLVVGTAATVVAAEARRRTAEALDRRREADLVADLARTLLGSAELATATQDAADLIGAAVGADSVELCLQPAATPAGRLGLALGGAARPLGTLLLPATLGDAALDRIRKRILPALEAVLLAALDRDALQREVVETVALRRSDVLKTTLLRSVSHDLRTPLTGIVAAGDALASPTLTDEERRELASVTATEGRRLARLVDDLLDLSRLEAGALEPRRDWCSLEEVLRTAIDEHPAGLAAFTVGIDPELPLVRADPVQLGRAIANLLDNAVVHGAGEPVSVRSRAVGTRLVVRIVDQGEGISPAELERIFAPFHRGAGQSTGGSGLGLAIVRGFVELNGGTVRAESLPGQGTSMVIELPLEPQPQRIAVGGP